MKWLITVFVVLVVIVGGFKLWDYWDKTNLDQEVTKRAEDGSDIREEELPGMPYQLETKYMQAKQKGTPGLKEFLDAYGKAPKFQDPRKAWIELNYAIAIIGSDPIEAKRIYLDVKGRVRTNAPIYRRIRSMEKAFQ